jgi:NADPH2:quinone reductase
VLRFGRLGRESPPANREDAMKVMLARAWGDPSTLEYADAPTPRPNAGEVVIEVRAIGCNFPDILIVQGKYQYKPELPFSPGCEVSGIVRGIGAGVTEVGLGERVFATMAWGGYAGVVAVDQRHVYALPDFMTFEEGAVFGLAYQTAWCGLVHRAGLRRGETLLVHAGAGGTGLAAVQLGRALGARVIATAGSAAKLEVARANGADVCIDYRTEAWVERVTRETHGEGANVIFDPVGGDVFEGSTRCLAFEGRLLVVGFAGGRIADVAGNRVLLKNISVVGVHWGLYRQRDATRVRRWMVELLKLAEARQLTPVIWRSFPLERAARALAAIGGRESYGKVVLIP